MVHINLKSAAKSEMQLAVNVAIVDLPRVNIALQQLVILGMPESGVSEQQDEKLKYPEDVLALGLPQAPRFFGELCFSVCPGTQKTLINGALTGQVPMRCQSCLSPFISQVNVDVCLAHIDSEDQGSVVPDGYEIFILDRQDTTLVELLEDDILLSLPAFPKHPEGQCDFAFELGSVNDDVEKKLSPFAGLKDLLQSGVKSDATRPG